MKSSRAATRGLVVAAAGLVMAVSACGTGPPVIERVVRPSTSAQPEPTPTPTPSPTPTYDAEVTTRVCTTAIQSAASAALTINNQISALEQAAADNDQTAMVRAAEAINTQFTVLAASFAALAQPLVTPPVRQALLDVSEALAEMASPRYTGTFVDIRKKLIDFAAAFGTACGEGASAR